MLLLGCCLHSTNSTEDIMYLQIGTRYLSQMGTDLVFLQSCWGFFPLTGRDYHRTDRDRHDGCCNRQELLTLPEHLGSLSFDREFVSLAFVCTLCILCFVSFCCLLFSCFLGLCNVLRLALWFFLPFFVISLFNNRFNRYRMETYMFILTKSNRRKSSNNCTGPHREDID